MDEIIASDCIYYQCLKYDLLIKVLNSTYFHTYLVLDVVTAENAFSHKYVEGKGNRTLNAFSLNCSYSLWTFVNIKIPFYILQAYEIKMFTYMYAIITL